MNKLIVDNYIKKIYLNNITTYTGIKEKRYFGDSDITVKIYPEAKKALMAHKCNWDKYEFLFDSDQAAQAFAPAKGNYPGIKTFKLTKSYAKNGFYNGENVAEIKITGFDGSRFAAKRPDNKNTILEFKYFVPNGFH
jgi:hypothetical protein